MMLTWIIEPGEFIEDKGKDKKNMVCDEVDDFWHKTLEVRN